MKNNKFIRFAHSLFVIPMLAGSSMSALPTSIPHSEIVQNVLVQKFNKEANGDVATNKAIDPEVLLQEARVKKAGLIDAYYERNGMPLKGKGMKMVLEAEKNNIDWRLLPAITVIETTGGQNLCKSLGEENNKNPFGWGSCEKGFKSFDEAIETVARNLGGNNPKTEKYYKNKSIKQILEAYNPPSIVPDYTKKVTGVMSAIGDADPVIIPNITT